MNSASSLTLDTLFPDAARANALPYWNTPSPISPSSSGPFQMHKDVSSDLLTSRSARNRMSGEVPYPLIYSNRNLDLDTIDHIMFVEMCEGLTLQKLPKPPARVLDLGCGGGMWIISAAEQWPETAFVGLDINDRQPNLWRIKQPSLASRIQWVHANFLELLPFQDGEFDLVRIQNIGLGVPEDEWQSLIEEIVRVLKPGGSLEIIEEDIMFPCPDTPINKTPRASPTMRGQMSRGQSDLTQDTAVEDMDKYYDGLYPSSKSRSLDTVYGGRIDQRDHSRLKDAFSQMLNIRFINPQVLTVLPFYLQAAFLEVQIFPAIRLYLPLPSGVVYLPEPCDSLSQFSSDSSSSTLVEPTTWGNLAKVDPRRHSDASNLAKIEPGSSSRVRLYLGRTIEIVRGCKEAMWKEYEKLHLMDRTVPNRRLDRDDFETYFHNWECDMQDRMGMRETLHSGLGINIPQGLPPPEWRNWREKGDSENVASFYASARPEPLRSLRGFVCKRPIHGTADGV